MKLARLFTIGWLITSSQLAMAGEIPCERYIDHILEFVGKPMLKVPGKYKFAQKSSGNTYNYSGITEALPFDHELEFGNVRAKEVCMAQIQIENARSEELREFDYRNKLALVAPYHQWQAEHRARVAQLEACRAKDDCDFEIEKRIRDQVANVEAELRKLKPRMDELQSDRAHIEESYTARLASYKDQCSRANKDLQSKMDAGEFVVCKTQKCAEAAIRGGPPNYEDNEAYRRNQEDIKELRQNLTKTEDPETRKNILGELKTLEAEAERLLYADQPVVVFFKSELDERKEIRVHTLAGDIRLDGKTCGYKGKFPCEGFKAHGLFTFNQCGGGEIAKDVAKHLFGRLVKKEAEEGVR